MPVAAVLAGSLAVVVIALTAVLFLFASKQFIDTQIAFIRGLPIVGPFAAAHLDQLAGAVQAQIQSWAAQAAHPIYDLLYRLVTRLHGYTLANDRAHAASAVTHADTRQVQIPAAQAAAITAAATADALLEERTTRHLQAVGRGIAQAQAAAQAYADQVGEAVRAYALALAVEDRQLARQDLVALGTAVERLVTASLTQAQADAREADAIATALLTALVRTAEQEARDLVSGLAEVVAQVSLDDRLYAQQQAGLVGAAATAAIAVVATAVDTINRSPCMQRCATLGNLGAALELLDLGLVLALVAEAARDPRGTGRLVRQVAQGPEDFARSVFAGLVGR